MAEADLVVDGTPDTMVAEGGAMTGINLLGPQHAWWNVRIRVDSVLKGKIGRARHVDYGNLPVWLSPPLGFRLAKNEIVVQQSSGWVTAPLVVGVRGRYFFKKCWDCVELPSRTQYRFSASPWFAILAVAQ